MSPSNHTHTHTLCKLIAVVMRSITRHPIYMYMYRDAWGQLMWWLQLGGSCKRGTVSIAHHVDDTFTVHPPGVILAIA